MRTARLLPFLLLGFAPAAACAKQDAVGITLALGTDLVVPDDINAVALVVSNAQTGALLAAPIINPTVPSAAGRAVRFPSTIALETAFKNDGSTFSFRRGERVVPSVQIALIGLKGRSADEAAIDGTAVTLRRIVTTMPEDGVHLLRLNLGTLDIGGATGNAGTLAQLRAVPAIGPANAVDARAIPLGNIQSTCDDPAQDFAGGACKPPNVIDGEALPLFDAAQVFGGSPNGGDSQAQCFDIPKCLADATPVVLDADGAVPSTGVKGFALVRADVLTTSASNAACVGDGAARRCFAPLDEPELSTTGAYTLDGTGRAKFGPGIVRALKSGKIRGLVAMQCAKTAGLPVCAPWSSVVNGNNRFATDAGPPPDASIDATVDANDAGFDSSTDAGSGPVDAGLDASGGGADAGPNPFVAVASPLVRVGDAVDGIVDFVLDPKSVDGNARINGAFVLGKSAVNLNAIGVSFVSKLNPQNADVSPNWDGEGIPATWPNGRVLRKPADADLTQLIAAASVTGQQRLYSLSVVRDAGGPRSITSVGKAVGSYAYTNLFLAGDSVYATEVGAQPLEHFFSRTTDLLTRGSPFADDPPAGVFSGAALASAGGGYKVLLGLGTRALYDFTAGNDGTPTFGSNGGAATNGFLPDPPGNNVLPDDPIEQIVAGSFVANANFYVVRRPVPTQTIIAAVQPNRTPIATFQPVITDTVDWLAQPSAPPPGVGYFANANGPLLIIAGTKGVSVYNATTGSRLGFLLRSGASDLDVRKITSEGGCVYFALWSGSQLMTATGMIPGGPGLYQVCLP